MQDEIELHYGTITGALNDGEIIPFLGAGANLCDRPDDVYFEPGLYLPSGGELAKYLAERFGYAHLAKPDLTWITQYITVAGRGARSLRKSAPHLQAQPGRLRRGGRAPQPRRHLPRPEFK